MHRFAQTVAFACSLLFLAPVTADARCRSPGTYPSVVEARSTEARSFTLFPGDTLITLVTDSAQDQLSFVVRRPSGRVICNKGPLSTLTCRPEVKPGTAGVYRISVINRNRRAVAYQLTCSDL